MRVLVTGAYGFIGAHVVRALVSRHAVVIGAGRDLDLGRRLLPDIEWRHADYNHLLTAGDWRPVLEGVQVIVNLVGILQSAGRDEALRIQIAATTALFEAAQSLGIRRVVHVSAVSAEPEVATEYATSRVAAEADLARRDLDWVIVKPSLVVAGDSYGGTSMLRGLAGIPFATPVPDVGVGRFQPIAMQDLAEGLAILALGTKPARLTLYATGPETVTVGDLARAYRRWLGLPPRRVLRIPAPLVRIGAWVGDLAAHLGSPSALRTAAIEQMRYADTFDPSPFAGILGRPLLTLDTQLALTPARIQDRLHTRLYVVRPLLQLTLALFWLATGLVALLPAPHAVAQGLLIAAGLPSGLAGGLVTAGAILDLVAGALMLSARWTRRAGFLQLGLMLAYLVLGSLLMPALWADPLGPLLKILPILAATLAVMAMAEPR